MHVPLFVQNEDLLLVQERGRDAACEGEEQRLSVEYGGKILRASAVPTRFGLGQYVYHPMLIEDGFARQRAGSRCRRAKKENNDYESPRIGEDIA